MGLKDLEEKKKQSPMQACGYSNSPRYPKENKSFTLKWKNMHFRAKQIIFRIWIHKIYASRLGKPCNHVGKNENDKIFLSKNFKFPDLLILHAGTNDRWL